MNLQMKSEMRHSKHLKLADRKKEITEEDLRALMLGEAAFAAQQYNITQLQVHFVSNSTQCATVVLKDEEGNVYEDATTGSGSIEAIYNAIQRILGLECELADYRIQSITQGQDALAHVHVELKKVVTKYQVSELRKTYWKRRRELMSMRQGN